MYRTCNPCSAIAVGAGLDCGLDARNRVLSVSDGSPKWTCDGGGQLGAPRGASLEANRCTRRSRQTANVDYQGATLRPPDTFGPDGDRGSRVLGHDHDRQTRRWLDLGRSSRLRAWPALKQGRGVARTAGGVVSVLSYDAKYSTFTLDQIIANYRTKAAATWPAIHGVADYALADGNPCQRQAVRHRGLSGRTRIRQSVALRVSAGLNSRPVRIPDRCRADTRSAPEPSRTQRLANYFHQARIDSAQDRGDGLPVQRRHRSRGHSRWPANDQYRP